MLASKTGKIKNDEKERGVFMLQRIWADTIWVKGMLAVCGLGIMMRLITIFSYRGMKKAAENAGRTKKRWVAALRKRYENYEKFDRMGNVEVFVDRFFARKGILGIPLSVWDKAVLQLSIVCFLMGLTGAFSGYILNAGTAKIVTTLFSGMMGAGILLFLHYFGGTVETKEQVITALKDYLTNGTGHRTSQSLTRGREKEEAKKKELPPTREEVEDLSEAAVTEEERQVLMEVLEEYFWEK